MGLGLFLALALRLGLFGFESGDYDAYFGPWYDFIVGHGRFGALGYGFSDYSPLYLYLLSLATYLPLPKLYAIKLLSVPLDLLLAFFVLLVIRLKYENRVVWAVSFFAALFAPTILLNGALWGQSDAAYASMLVASVYFAIRRRPVLSLILFLRSAFVQAAGYFSSSVVRRPSPEEARPCLLFPHSPRHVRGLALARLGFCRLFDETEHPLPKTFGVCFQAASILALSNSNPARP